MNKWIGKVTALKYIFKRLIETCLSTSWNRHMQRDTAKFCCVMSLWEYTANILARRLSVVDVQQSAGYGWLCTSFGIIVVVIA